MPQKGFNRKPIAIASANAVGLNRIMREDEETTLHDVAAHRVLITETSQQQGNNQNNFF